MEDKEKFSSRRQWQERSDRPVATRSMTREQIEEFRQVLANSYHCDIADISYEFEKIFNENDEDRDDCLILHYKMKSIWHGKPTLRTIYSLKLPIPEELKMMAEKMKRQGKTAQYQRTPRAAADTAASANAPPVVIEGVSSVQHEPTRPVLRKPVRKVASK